MEDNRTLVPNDKQMDRQAMLNMEKCAAFLARMIEKYGQEVLAEIEAREAARTENME